MTKFTETLIFFLENWFHVIKNIYFLQSRVQENFRLLLKLQWVFQLTRQNLFIISNWNEKLSLRQAIAYEKNQQYSYSFKKCLAFMRTFNFNKQNKNAVCMFQWQWLSFRMFTFFFSNVPILVFRGFVRLLHPLNIKVTYNRNVDKPFDSNLRPDLVRLSGSQNWCYWTVALSETGPQSVPLKLHKITTVLVKNTSQNFLSFFEILIGFVAFLQKECSRLALFMFVS